MPELIKSIEAVEEKNPLSTRAAILAITYTLIKELAIVYSTFQINEGGSTTENLILSTSIVGLDLATSPSLYIAVLLIIYNLRQKFNNFI